MRLTGAFELGIDGRAVHVPLGAQRVLAYLALARRAVPRSQCAGALWDYGTQPCADRNLRSALWRIRRLCGDLVVRDQDRLALSVDLVVEVGELAGLVERLVLAGDSRDYPAMGVLLAEPILLPAWGDAWVIAERERMRMLWLYTLEQAAHSLAAHRPDAALLAATAAVQTEPLRESAWRLVVELHRQQGNLVAARRAYEDYRRLLVDELGAVPSPIMERLVAHPG